MYKWIDDKSVLLCGKVFIKSGDIIPADKLSEERIKTFLSKNKIIKIDKKEVNIKSKKSEVNDDNSSEE